jgi:hypothetical protein
VLIPGDFSSVGMSEEFMSSLSKPFEKPCLMALGNHDTTQKNI